MQYTNLGRTGLKVSRLCLGTMNFGPRATEPESSVIMDRALEAGVQFFDTADVDGWKDYEGGTCRRAPRSGGSGIPQGCGAGD